MKYKSVHPHIARSLYSTNQTRFPANLLLKFWPILVLLKAGEFKSVSYVDLCYIRAIFWW
jgi:hypothetical protein